MKNKEDIIKRLSYHVVYDTSILDAIDFASNNGFSGIQIATDALHLSFENKTTKELMDIKNTSQEKNIKISLHAPDSATLVFPYSNINGGIISYYKDLIRFAHQINAQIITIHPGTLPTFPLDYKNVQTFPTQDIERYKEIISLNIKTLLKLSEDKVNICIENVALEDIVMEVLQNYLGKTNLGLCWDFAKTYDKKTEELNKKSFEFMIKNKKYIKQLHLHSRKNGKAHRIIQNGLIDFNYYFNLLEDVNILDYCIEVRPRESAVESMNNLKEIINV